MNKNLYKKGVSYGNVIIPCYGITGKECIEEISVLRIKLSLVIFIYDNIFTVFFKMCACFILFFGCVGSLLLRTGFSLVVASGGYPLLQCTGFSLRWLLLLQSTGSRVHGLQ